MSNTQEQSVDGSFQAPLGPPPIQIPNESSGNYMASPLTTSTPTSSFAMRPIVLEEGEGVNEKEIHGHKRPLTSKAWESFKRQKINGTWKAICIYCGKTLGGETRNGTKNLHDHLKSCPLKCATDIRQTFLKIQRNSDGKTELTNAAFNKENARKELACMIALHEYPLSIVDHIGFRRFVAALQPKFKMVSRNTIKKDMMNIYQQEKSRKMKWLEENQSRIAITTSMWTSNQKRGYMVITAHYLDSSWILQS